jgi:moderate conductance mechanosensitive channel
VVEASLGPCKGVGAGAASLARLLVLFLFILLAGSAVAQSQPAPPPQLDPAQFNALVEAISQAVVKKLKDEGAVAVPDRKHAAAGAAPTTDGAEKTAEEDLEQESVQFFQRLGRVGSAFPAFLSALADGPALLSPPEGGTRGLGAFLILLAAATGIALGAEFVARLLLAPIRQHFAATIDKGGGLIALGSIAIADFLALMTVWGAVHALVAAWFHDGSHQSVFATAVLTSIFSWRLYMFAFRVCFRPALPQARLAEISNEDAKAIYRGVGTAVLFLLLLRVVLRSLLGAGAASDAIASGQVASAILIVAVFIAVALSLRRPVADWLRGLSTSTDPGPVVAALSANWLAIAIPLFVALGVAQIYGSVEGHFNVGHALILTLNVIIGLLLLETFVDRAKRFQMVRKEVSGDPRPRLGEPILRCLRVIVLVVAAGFVAEAWFTDVLGLVTDSTSFAWLRTASAIGIVVIAAYCTFEVVNFATARYVIKKAGELPSADHEDDASQPNATRLATLMPLLRVALMVVIFVLAALTIASQLGLNVTALVAGASVIGLAISFGSQTLVKDIVSGVFYLVDDAFRVGEYIDCGKAKGTVEGFTLRSLKLRHQNGQVHTIPFGQLGQITNFSRDWTTMKFNLRFVRTTDIEKLRKTVKKIGQEMQADPELADEILVPLKMQGVTDIADNALVVRFKFTVRPSKPTFVYREALKRMFRKFPEEGLEFANAMVAVQTLGGAVPDTAMAGAAARATIAKMQAEAAASGDPAPAS